MTQTGQGGTRMPVLFLGHGSPMNAIEDNRWSQAFQAIGRTLPRPSAVVAVSAHWLEFISQAKRVVRPRFLGLSTAHWQLVPSRKPQIKRAIK